MMFPFVEKEVKILDIDVQDTIAKLEEVGAKKIFSGSIHDTYYDTPDKSLAIDKKRLRIRKKGDTYYITMKQRISDTSLKSRYEYEKEIHDIEYMYQHIADAGLVPSYEKRKARFSYALGDIVFDIDMYTGIPALLEIEGPDKEAIYTWIDKLGLQKKTISTVGSHGLGKLYNKEICSYIEASKL